MNSTCASEDLLCNCDQNDNIWRFDDGDLTFKQDLPVTAFVAGDTGKAGLGFQCVNLKGRLFRFQRQIVQTSKAGCLDVKGRLIIFQRQVAQTSKAGCFDFKCRLFRFQRHVFQISKARCLDFKERLLRFQKELVQISNASF